ncbi:aldehyde dehydrogenase family protein [Gammaproteobacteria bacterium 42_54_T18]|nr:aldehyde dehydrogenase family protein [Gammaproteobacteria bacterium 42_54_T18]
MVETKAVFTQKNGCFVSTVNEILPLIDRGESRVAWAAVCVGENEGPVKAESMQTFPVHSPIDNQVLGYCGIAEKPEMLDAVSKAHDSFLQWRIVPAPKRGELIRRFAEKVRQDKGGLAKLITLEAGKTWQESLGEVQEVIDVCEFAVGLSRQLHGLTIASERPSHRMMEQWHPLGVVGIITAFNFPMAVWAWNAALALVCGNAVVWKPSEKTPLCALACHRLLVSALRDMGELSRFPALSVVINGHKEIGEYIADHTKIPLVSATGSIPMGRSVAEHVARRLGRSLLELGGNNALIVTSSADIAMALKAVVFSAVGTSGQRCTSLRRLFVHESVADVFLEKLVATYTTIKIGDPRDENNLCGPVINGHTRDVMDQAINDVRLRGGQLLVGGKQLVGGQFEEDVCGGGVYLEPAIVEVSSDEPLLQQETFAPLLFVVRYQELHQAIAWQNDVPQGLSSAIFTNDIREAEVFMSASGSDCGIANVNIGTSGAEIGGAFGGEKDTGGGRESGSDAWKQYMRRVTNTINYGEDIPLAQGIRFEL